MRTPRTVVLLCLDIPFTLIHLSVVVFILATRRKDAVIRSGFHTLFAITAVADIIHQLVTIIFQQLPVMWDFFAPLIEPDKNAYPSIRSSIANSVLTYAILLQGLGHTLMTLNRFSCFYFHLRHERIWRGRRLKTTIALMLVLPLVGVAYFLPFRSHIYPSGHPPYDTVAIEYLPDEVDKINLCVIAVSYVVLGTTNFALSIATVFAIRSFQKEITSGSLRTNADVRLFAHSVAMLVLQLYLAFHYTYYADLLPDAFYTTAFVNTVPRVARFIIDSDNLTGSPFLLALSRDVRRKFFEFYFGGMPRSRVSSHFQRSII